MTVVLIAAGVLGLPAPHVPACGSVEVSVRTRRTGDLFSEVVFNATTEFR